MGQQARKHIHMPRRVKPARADERSGLRSANDALQALDLADEVVDYSQRHGYG